MAAYSLDLRNRVLRAWDSGMDAERCGGEVRAQPGVRLSTGAAAARDGLDRAADANEVSGARLVRPAEERLSALILARPDATLAEWREALPTGRA